MIQYLNLKKLNAQHGEEIKDAINKVVDSGWYLRKEATKQFEEHYAQYIGTKYCVGCGNGLDALTLIFRAYKEMGIMKDGDEVIVSGSTFIATILSITENNLKPVFIDCRLDTYQIDDSLIEQAITPRTRAILIVHLYGKCAYTEKIRELCKKHDLKLVEDNAQAQGCRFGNKHTGSLGDAAAHSFYPGKNLGALGDAGAVTTNDPKLESLVRDLGSYGAKIPQDFYIKGRNSRMDEIQAAVLDVKLKYLDEENRRRREIAEYYCKNIHNPAIKLPNSDYIKTSVHHIFPVLCEDSIDLMHDLFASHEIISACHYQLPPHKQYCYREYADIELPNTEMLFTHERSIPLNSTLTQEEIEAIVEALNSYRYYGASQKNLG